MRTRKHQSTAATESPDHRMRPSLPPHLPDLPVNVGAALTRQARERAFTWWQWGCLQGVFFVLFIPAVVGGGWLGPRFLGLSRVVGILAGSLLGCVVSMAFWHGWVNRRVNQRYRGILAEHGRCPQCGYDLAGTPDAGVCPECGTPVRDRGTRTFAETAAIDSGSGLRRLAILLPWLAAGLGIIFWAAARQARYWVAFMAGGWTLMLLGSAAVHRDRRRLRKRRGLCPRCGCEPKGGTICCNGCEDASRCR